MLRVSALALASLLMVSAPAMAQRAPVTRGVTSSDLAAQVDEARQQSAELKVQLNGLLGDMMNLTGRVETLEYQLGQSERARERLDTDNEALSAEVVALKREIADLRARISASQSGLSSSDDGLGGSLGTGPTVTRSVTGMTGSGLSSDEAEFGDTASSVSRQPTTTRTVTRSGPTRIVTTINPSNGSLNAAGAAADDGTGLGELPEGSLGTIPASALPGAAGPAFDRAKSKFLRFDYAGAEEAFSEFIEAFGDDPQAGEAHYWLGEALYNQKAYPEAGAAYTTMIRSYPDDARAPDALVRLGRVMRLLGDTEKACLALDTFPKRYPNASSTTRDLAAVERTKARCDS